MLTTFIRLRSKGTAQPATLPRTTYRVDSIDFLRGLVMIIMALDHTRDFFHVTAFTDNPLNLATTTPVLFLTRWITHFCAPVFVFLAGTSAFFQHKRKSTKELSRFLISRGLWLVFIEVAVINFAVFFDPSYSTIGLQTIWAIGISMIILGLAIWLPFKVVFSIGLLIVLGHNTLDFYETNHTGNFSAAYSLLHRPGFYSLGNGRSLLILYPFLPWAGLMMLGYCFGKFFTIFEGKKQRKVLTQLGFGLIVFFIVLRASNLYGDAQHWSIQKNALYTVFSFIDTVKYPPSLLYMCMTVGPAILLVAWMDSVKNSFTRFVTVFGRVPFFYYVLHFFLIHLLSMGAFFSRGHSFAEGIQTSPDAPFNFLIAGEGYSLLVVYAVWLFVVLSLYPLCRWFSRYKQTHRQWWLSYL